MNPSDSYDLLFKKETSLLYGPFSIMVNYKPYKPVIEGNTMLSGEPRAKKLSYLKVALARKALQRYGTQRYLELKKRDIQ